MTTGEERYDLVIYGASGFTGKYVLEALVNHKSKSDSLENITFAVAGRNTLKLEKTLQEVSALTGRDLSQVPIIIADSSVENDLAEMAKKAKVIVNVVGPVCFLI